jgi:hypothetical protein
MHISSLAPSHCKPVFKGEFYLRFVSFSIRVSNHVEYEIEHSSSSMVLNRLQLCDQVTKGATYRLD